MDDYDLIDDTHFVPIVNYRELTEQEIKEYEILDANAAAERRKLVEDARRASYQQIADPLFFKWQAGEGTEQEWLDARASIVEMYPYEDSVQ